MPSNVASDFFIAILLASATLAGLVAVFLATASNQIKVYQRYDRLWQRPMVRYTASQYLLLELAALTSFILLAATFIISGLVILISGRLAGFSAARSSAPEMLGFVTASQLPTLCLSLLFLAVGLMLAALVALVYNDHKYTINRIRGEH